MSVLKVLFALCMFFLLQGSGCSTNVEKLEFEYKDDFSGLAKAKIDVGKEDNGKRVVPTDELDELYKVSNVCDITLREIYGYDKKFIAEYKFSSYEELRKASECSKKTQESVIFYPLDIKEGLLTKDITLKMVMYPVETGGLNFSSSGLLPDELIITVPGEIKNVSFDYHDILGFFSYFIINEKSSNSTYEVIGNNKVVFKIRETRKKTREADNTEQKIKARCGSDEKSEEVKSCNKREAELIAAEYKRQISKQFDEDFRKPGFRFSITTRINKWSKFLNIN